MSIEQAPLVDQFVSAFAARDANAVAGLFTDDAAYHDIIYGTVMGRSGIRALFERMFTESAATWRVTRTLTGRHHIVAEWLFDMVVTDAVPRSAGRALSFPGVSVYETTADGRCHTYREYFDRAAVLLAQGIPAATVAEMVARRSTVRTRC